MYYLKVFTHCSISINNFIMSMF
uniref:Uncharacterized protein n=1 Tax=Anguilla anguilla TaxID=7936 RepID=A0A0E9RWS3_ANGAN